MLCCGWESQCFGVCLCHLKVFGTGMLSPALYCGYNFVCRDFLALLPLSSPRIRRPYPLIQNAFALCYNPTRAVDSILRIFTVL